jgi:hypothetical protein
MEGSIYVEAQYAPYSTLLKSLLRQWRNLYILYESSIHLVPFSYDAALIKLNCESTTGLLHYHTKR